MRDLSASRLGQSGVGRRVALLLAIVLFCAAVQGLLDWASFMGATIALRFVLRLGQDHAMLQTAPFPWVFEVAALVGTPAAIYGAAIGWLEAFGRGASFYHALLSALLIGAASVAVFATLWPDRDPPEFPMRSIEIAKVLTFMTTGLACWWVVRRACADARGPAS